MTPYITLIKPAGVFYQFDIPYLHQGFGEGRMGMKLSYITLEIEYFQMDDIKASRVGQGKVYIRLGGFARN